MTQADIGAIVQAAVEAALAQQREGEAEPVQVQAPTCAWGSQEWQDGSCDNAVTAKRKGGWRRYCPEHAAQARKGFREHVLEPAREAKLARHEEAAAILADAVKAADGARASGGATLVRMTPAAGQLARFAQAELGAERDKNTVVVRFPNRGAAQAFAKVVNGATYDASAPTAVEVAPARRARS